MHIPSPLGSLRARLRAAHDRNGLAGEKVPEKWEESVFFFLRGKVGHQKDTAAVGPLVSGDFYCAGDEAVLDAVGHGEGMVADGSVFSEPGEDGVAPFAELGVFAGDAAANGVGAVPVGV